MPEPSPAVQLDRQLTELLRSCIQCGLCLNTCATWLASGNEVMSPRGRLMLLGEFLADDEPDLVPEFQVAFDSCIGCRACETACPSGVPYDLLAHGHNLAERKPLPGSVGLRRSGLRRLLERLDSPHFLQAVAWGGRMATGVLRGLLGPRWRRRLEQSDSAWSRGSRLLGTLPTSPRTDRDLVCLLEGLLARRTGSAAGPPAVSTFLPPDPAFEVAFFAGCANKGLLPATSRRLRELLEGSGCRVELPPGQQCCGALAAHAARPGRAENLRQLNREAFAGALAAGRQIVVEAAGCGLHLQSYPRDFAGQVTDAVSMLARLEIPFPNSIPLKVAIHDPCHGRHGQGIVREPREILGRIPDLEVLEVEEAEVCCGSGGTWGLRYQELSASLGRRKAAMLAGSGADLVVTSNPGCLGQIADGLLLEAPDLPILPLTDLLWFAARRSESI